MIYLSFYHFKEKITFLNSYLSIEFHTFALVFKASQSITDRFAIDIALKEHLFKIKKN